jgi:hypothetical protein
VLHRSDSAAANACCNAVSTPAWPSCRAIRRKWLKMGDNRHFQTLFGFDSPGKNGSIPPTFSEANQIPQPVQRTSGGFHNEQE